MRVVPGSNPGWAHYFTFCSDVVHRCSSFVSYGSKNKGISLYNELKGYVIIL